MLPTNANTERTSNTRTSVIGKTSDEMHVQNRWHTIRHPPNIKLSFKPTGISDEPIRRLAACRARLSQLFLQRGSLGLMLQRGGGPKAWMVAFAISPTNVNSASTTSRRPNL